MFKSSGPIAECPGTWEGIGVISTSADVFAGRVDFGRHCLSSQFAVRASWCKRQIPIGFCARSQALRAITALSAGRSGKIIGKLALEWMTTCSRFGGYVTEGRYWDRKALDFLAAENEERCTISLPGPWLFASTGNRGAVDRANAKAPDSTRLHHLLPATRTGRSNHENCRIKAIETRLQRMGAWRWRRSAARSADGWRQQH